MVIGTITDIGTTEEGGTTVDVEDAREKIGNFKQEMKRVEASFKAMEAILGKVPIDVKAYLVVELSELMEELSSKVSDARHRYVQRQ